MSGVNVGGGSSNREQGWISESNTTQSNNSVGNTVSVQHFATGGLNSALTLAIMAEESKKEGVAVGTVARKQLAQGKGLLRQERGALLRATLVGVGVFSGKLLRFSQQFSRLLNQLLSFLLSLDSPSNQRL